VVFGDATEVSVCGQQRELETDAQLRQQGVDRADLKPTHSAIVSEICGIDMVPALGHEESERGEAINDCGSRSWPSKSLQELLQDQAGREDRFATSECPPQLRDFQGDVEQVAPQSQRPDTGVDEDAQPRDRSPL
jgi:hypothetical protein